MYQRIVQLLAFLAVISPWCCCDAGEVSLVPAQASAAAHGCCEDSVPGAAQESPERDCPHETGNASLESAADFGAAAEPARLPIAAVGLFDAWTARPELSLQPAAWINRKYGANIPPPGFGIRFGRFLI